MRGLSNQFLNAMRQGLKRGRNKGYVGWDQHWKNTAFPCSPTGWMMMRLHQEIDELVVALNKGSPDLILREAADVANFAMFIADMEEE